MKIRPQSLTLRGAAENGSRMPGGGSCGASEAWVQSGIAAPFKRIARALFTAWLFCWPVAAFAQQPPTLGSVGILNAGASCPGKTEGN